MSLPVVLGLALFTSGYFLKDVLDEFAPESTPFQESFSPPFTGGQCVGTNYLVRVNGILSGTIGGSPATKTVFIQFFATGAIGSVTVGAAVETGNQYVAPVSVNGTVRASLPFSGVADIPPFVVPVGTVPSITVTLSGSPDNCGNTPNPNPSFPPSTTGLSGGGFDPDAEPLEEVEGAFPAILPFLSLLADIIDAIKNATNVLDAIKKIGDAFDSLKELLDALRKFLDKDNSRGNKSVLSFSFGKVSRDGFLRLYPSSGFDGLECVQLDILMLAIPLGYGREVGVLSPNFYRYRELGRISFVSGSFGIIENRKIEFGRTSLSVPDGSIGFYYQFGLENEAIASLSALYTKEGTPITTQ